MPSTFPYVALLRGINVGGRNPLPMARLRAVFEGLGHRGVETYIQSGNVLFRDPAGVERIIVRSAERCLREELGFDAAVLLRTGEELAEIVRRNPLVDPAVDLGRLLVVFLPEPPAATAVARLDPRRSPPDVFAILGREIFLHCPNGFGRSKLSVDYFEKKLGVRATARNWRTVVALAALAARPAL